MKDMSYSSQQGSRAIANYPAQKRQNGVSLPSVATMQMKKEQVFQRAAPEEETLQGKFAPIQVVEEQEPLQGKFGTKQKQATQAANHTGMPNNLKSGIEDLSGVDVSDVKVHYNSSKPAQLNAHAYAQGSDIHIAPGQEKHLPHEAWHTVQQKQGRVKPTVQMKENVPVNDDPGLEHEADVMGAKATQFKNNKLPSQLKKALVGNQSPLQLVKRGFLEGISKSKFIANLVQEGVLTETELTALDTTGKSVTLLNQEVVKLITEKIKTKYPEQDVSMIGAVTASSPVSPGVVIGAEQGNAISNLVQELRALKGERTKDIPEAVAQANMGIDPVNLAAIQKILRLRDESLVVRPVGEGNVALQAANHQRANLPTKPFSIKLKSEKDTGFIPINQFNDKPNFGDAPEAKAFQSIDDKASALTNAYIVHQLDELQVRPDDNTIIKIEKLLSIADIETSKRGLELLKHVAVANGVKAIDNHIAAKGEEIISNAGASGEYMSRILNGKGKKYFLVNQSSKLPIVGDYDIYRIIAQNASINDRLVSIEGAGDSNSFVMGAAIDYNVAVALSGYMGGLVFHHGAEMHNVKFAQPQGRALAIDENYSTPLSAPGLGFDTDAYTALKLYQGGHSTVRPETAKKSRLLASAAYHNPKIINDAIDESRETFF
jgi:hypothetical protein